MKLIYTCREMADLVSLELDSSLSLSVRMRMALHLSMCKNCQIYREQIHQIETCLESYYADSSDDSAGLTEERKNSIKRMLSRENS